MKRKKPAKTYILDTNVILHDPSCITHFQENDIVIPLAVIDEIDHFKRGSELINLNARDFARRLDELSGDGIFGGGISLGKGMGSLKIVITNGLSDEVRHAFREDNADHRILSAAYELYKKAEDKTLVRLVTKDVNLRMKAKAIGVLAEDYTSDRISNPDTLYRGQDCIENLSEESMQKIFEPPYQIAVEELPRTEMVANKYFILKSSSRSALARYDAKGKCLRKIETSGVFGINPRNAEQSFAISALTDPEIPLVTISGKAGTGKTLLALASALQVKKLFRQIFVARPVVPLSNKDLGFLPGDVDQKLAPYMQPLWDNLRVIQEQYKETDKNFMMINNLIEEEKLIIEPLSYIRGRSLERIFFIVDESQNLTPHEIKTVITRAGEGSKVVIMGDIYQIDHPYLDSQSNGLSYLIEKFKGQELYAHVNLEKGERSRLAELASNLL